MHSTAHSCGYLKESLCREKERTSAGARRSAEPAKASLLKLQSEVSQLNQQLAEAVQAAEAAESRYRQSRAQLRYEGHCLQTFQHIFPKMNMGFCTSGSSDSSIIPDQPLAHFIQLDGPQ